MLAPQQGGGMGAPIGGQPGMPVGGYYGAAPAPYMGGGMAPVPAPPSGYQGGVSAPQQPSSAPAQPAPAPAANQAAAQQPAPAGQQQQPGFLDRIFKRGGGDQQQQQQVQTQPNQQAPQQQTPEDQQAQQPGFFGRIFGGGSSNTDSNSAAQTDGQPGESVLMAGGAVPGGVSPGGMPAGAMPQGPATPTMSPGITGPAPEVSKFGPFLKFNGYDPASRQWRASVLYIAHQARSPQPPMLRFRDVNIVRSETQVPPVHLDHYQGWNFWRYDLVVECSNAPRTVEYCVSNSTDHVFTYLARYRFVVPAANQKWRWGFYSCNGFHDPENERQMGGIGALWKDVLHNHQQSPFHLMVGGGDQVYCDAVWQSPALMAWCSIRDPVTRLQHPFTQDMVNQVFHYFFTRYSSHWSEPEFGTALSCIPQIMTWDDHDIFDGWGSYPHDLQRCPVFQGVYYIARKFYALFQHHSTVERVPSDNGTFGLEGWHQVTCMGSSTALVLLDCRAERTIDYVVRPESWAMIQQRIAALPGSVRHVVVVATVPVIYPHIPAAESALSFLQGSGRSRYGIIQMMQKTGLADSLISQFGTVDILDDLMDHWTAKGHVQERAYMVHMLQELAAVRGFRFTFLSGDVHVASCGKFMSWPKRNLRTDHRYMLQVTSSAIGNAPPPSGVVKALTASARAKMFDKDTRECMVNLFGVKECIRARRNWCLVTERPYIPGAAGFDGVLTFQLRVEHPQYKATRPETFEVSVPPLDLPGGPSPAYGPMAGLRPALPTPMGMPGYAPGAAAAGAQLPPITQAPYQSAYPRPLGQLPPMGGASGPQQQPPASAALGLQPPPYGVPQTGAHAPGAAGAAVPPQGLAPPPYQQRPPSMGAPGDARPPAGLSPPPYQQQLQQQWQQQQQPAPYQQQQPSTQPPYPQARPDAVSSMGGAPPAGGPPPGTPAWLLNQSATPGTFMPPVPVGAQQPAIYQQQPGPQPSQNYPAVSQGGAPPAGQGSYPQVPSQGAAAAPPVPPPPQGQQLYSTPPPGVQPPSQPGYAQPGAHQPQGGYPSQQQPPMQPYPGAAGQPLQAGAPGQQNAPQAQQMQGYPPQQPAPAPYQGQQARPAAGAPAAAGGYPQNMQLAQNAPSLPAQQSNQPYQQQPQPAGMYPLQEQAPRPAAPPSAYQHPAAAQLPQGGYPPQAMAPQQPAPAAYPAQLQPGAYPHLAGVQPQQGSYPPQQPQASGGYAPQPAPGMYPAPVPQGASYPPVPGQQLAQAGYAPPANQAPPNMSAGGAPPQYMQNPVQYPPAQPVH